MQIKLKNNLSSFGAFCIWFKLHNLKCSKRRKLKSVVPIWLNLVWFNLIAVYCNIKIIPIKIGNFSFKTDDLENELFEKKQIEQYNNSIEGS